MNRKAAVPAAPASRPRKRTKTVDRAPPASSPRPKLATPPEPHPSALAPEEIAEIVQEVNRDQERKVAEGYIDPRHLLRDEALARMMKMRVGAMEILFAVRSLEPSSKASEEADHLFGWLNFMIGEGSMYTRQSKPAVGFESSLAAGCGWERVLCDLVELHGLMLKAYDDLTPDPDYDAILAVGERGLLDALAAGAWLAKHGFVNY